MRAGFLATAVGLALIPVAAQAASAPMPVQVVGRVVSPDGGPARGVTVSLNRDVSSLSSVGGALGTALTLGLACLQQAVKICQQNNYSAATAADGAFAISLSP